MPEVEVVLAALLVQSVSHQEAEGPVHVADIEFAGSPGEPSGPIVGTEKRAQVQGSFG